MDTAQVIREQLKNIGVNVTINPVEWEYWLEEVYGNRNFESTVVGVDAKTLSARSLLERFKSDGGSNFINFSDEEYDEVLSQAIASMDGEGQTKCYMKLQEILTEKAASVYIQDLASLVALRDDFDGYEFYPLYVQDMAKIYRVE